MTIKHDDLYKETLQVIDLKPEVEKTLSKYEDKEKKELRKALEIDEAPFVYQKNHAKAKSFIFKGGLFKIMRHKGPDDKKYLIMQNAEIQAQFCLVYEIKSENYYKLRFNSRKLGNSDSTFAFFAGAEKDQNPHVLV